MYQNFIYVATQIMESEGRVWLFNSLRSSDRKAELAAFTACSNGVFCVISYHQGAQSEIFVSQKRKDVNKFNI